MESAEAIGGVGSKAREFSMGRIQFLALALVLVAAHPAIPYWIIYRFTNYYELYRRLGLKNWTALFDTLQCVMPLLLCLSAPQRSGLILGCWKPHTAKALFVCLVPVILTAIIYPLTSKPFTDDRITVWLVSPAAQDLLFSAFLYGIARELFPERVAARLPFTRAMIVVGLLFAAWHLPNFTGINAGYVVFQLIYTFLGLIWMLLAREMTGSVLPVIATHMAVNFLSYMGW